MSEQEQEELSKYKIEEVEDYLNLKLPEVLKEYAKLPKPKTKEEKEIEWQQNLRPVECPTCGYEYKLGEIKPYICYVRPAKFAVVFFESKTDYEEFTMIGSYQYHHVLHGVSYSMELELQKCIVCETKKQRIRHYYYRPNFTDDEPLESRLEARIRSDIDDIINPYCDCCDDYDY